MKDRRSPVNCPVCKKEARTHIIKCASCGVYVHEKCWQKHMETEHEENKE